MGPLSRLAARPRFARSVIRPGDGSATSGAPTISMQADDANAPVNARTMASKHGYTRAARSIDAR